MPSVAELLFARSADDHVGLCFEDSSWTWREVVEESYLRADMIRGLRREGPLHLGVLLENVPEYMFLLCGAALAGATVVGINPTRRGEELAGDIYHTDCQLILTSSDQLSLLEGLDTGVERDRVLVCDSPQYLELLEKHSSGSEPSRQDPGGLPGPDSLWLLLFTSGSTGAPKAVRASQRRIAAAAEVMVTGSVLSEKDVIYCPMPMFHGNAIFICVVPAIASGATLVLRRRFSASGFLPDVRRYGVTFFSYVGRALAHILSTPEGPDDAENSLRMGFGTDASPRDMTSFERRFRCMIVEGYGSSEGAISMSRAPGTPREALGLPPDGADVIIVDPESGVECPRARIDESGALLNGSEAIGEIVSRNGVGRFEGYYANPDAEAQRTREGWFWSGDLGYRDEDGYFYFAGRPADWLRVDGENFASAPVERILARFDGVVTAAVYPVADPRTGDQVMAALELTDGTEFDPVAFAKFLDDQRDLGTKWAPRFVRIVERMPLTGTGKLDKRPLREARWVTTDEVWWRTSLRKGAGDEGYRRLGLDDVEAIRSEFAANGRERFLELSS